jgi:TonB family protein
MRFRYKPCRFAILALIISSVYLPARAQYMPEIEILATRTTERVAKSHPKQVFIGMRQGCILSTQLCEDLDSKLRTLLEAAVSGIQFSSKEDVVSLLKNHGFLSIDVFQDSILRTIVPTLGVDVLVVENLVWKGANYELSSKIIDVRKDKEVDTFTVKIARSGTDNEEKPVFFGESQDGPFLFALRGNSNHFPPFRYPACDKCPDPIYPEEARHKGLEGTVVFLATVSEQGMAEQVGLIKSIDSGLTASALQAIRSWRFKPAIGLDGKPIAVRIPIEVTFRMAR